MKKIFTTIILIIFFATGFSQITDVEKKLKTIKTDTADGWKKGGTITLNLTQVSLSNWSAGGQNTISANGLINLFATYKKEKGVWENYLDIGYGSIKQSENQKWWKSDDKIDLTSKYGQKAFSNFYYAALLNFKTQMDAGYKYPDDSTKISDLLAPGYLVAAIGMDYKPNDNLTAFFAPITGKTTYVNDLELADAGAYGVEPAVYDTAGNMLSRGKTHRNEFGGYIRLFYKLDVMKNVNLTTKLDLFSNYLENPQNIDVSWEVLVSMKINKYISATITTHLLYDDDTDIAIETDAAGKPIKVGPRTQFKEVLGVGFSYKF
ncbi:MAG: DUF3078 domain-containing protein [Saprospiraceae bacterium]|nr:DUF3078 domain-containing protein [Saprospiraceae bacterium]